MRVLAGLFENTKKLFYVVQQNFLASGAPNFGPSPQASNLLAKLVVAERTPGSGTCHRHLRKAWLLTPYEGNVILGVQAGVMPTHQVLGRRFRASSARKLKRPSNACLPPCGCTLMFPVLWSIDIGGLRAAIFAGSCGHSKAEVGRNRKSRFLRDLVRATSANGSQCRLLEKGPNTPAHDPPRKHGLGKTKPSPRKPKPKRRIATT